MIQPLVIQKKTKNIVISVGKELLQRVKVVRKILEVIYTYLESFSVMDVAPSYCRNCGSPFPWTKEKLNAAKELAELLDELTPEEQEQLKMSLNDLVKDGPRTVVATTRFKRLISKTSPEIISGFRDILVDVVSETVKKAIWG
jgi:hypothetical protein